VEADLAAGTLVEILADFPPSPSPVFALYPQNRQLAPRVRVFIDWLAAEFAVRLPPHIDEAVRQNVQIDGA
jgi:DNA-binding transcriptional LysR family regulator